MQQKETGLALSHRSFNLHLINLFDTHDEAIKTARFAPSSARFFDLTTKRYGVMELSEMSENGYVKMLFLDDSGREYEDRVQYPSIVPLSVLIGVLDLRQKQAAIHLHRTYVGEPSIRPIEYRAKLSGFDWKDEANELQHDFRNYTSTMHSAAVVSKSPTVRPKSRFARYVPGAI